MSALVSTLRMGVKIGEGNFAEVFSAVDAVKGKVAVKKLKRGPRETDAEFSARRDNLLHEGRRLESAHHPNIVQVFQVAKDGDDYCLVTELCDSSLLKDYQKEPMSLARLREIATQVCRGLQHIHATGMVHRDIKPSNIFASGNEIKIGDFGLVSNNIIAGYASMQGYQDHLPPEFWKNNATNIKSDVWALGMTLYRLLNGEEFYNEHVGKGNPRNKVTKGNFAKKLPWLPHIPEIWRKLIRKAMHDDPKQRFQNVNALSRALSKVIVKPDWECDFSPDIIRWRLTKGRSVLTVEFQKVGKKYIWSCDKSPRGKNIVRKAKKPAPKSKVWKELNAFFSAMV